MTSNPIEIIQEINQIVVHANEVVLNAVESIASSAMGEKEKANGKKDAESVLRSMEEEAESVVENMNRLKIFEATKAVETYINKFKDKKNKAKMKHLDEAAAAAVDKANTADSDHVLAAGAEAIVAIQNANKEKLRMDRRMDKRKAIGLFGGTLSGRVKADGSLFVSEGTLNEANKMDTMKDPDVNEAARKAAFSVVADVTNVWKNILKLWENSEKLNNNNFITIKDFNSAKSVKDTVVSMASQIEKITNKDVSEEWSQKMEEMEEMEEHVHDLAKMINDTYYGVEKEEENESEGDEKKMTEMTKIVKEHGAGVAAIAFLHVGEEVKDVNKQLMDGVDEDLFQNKIEEIREKYKKQMKIMEKKRFRVKKLMYMVKNEVNKSVEMAHAKVIVAYKNIINYIMFNNMFGEDMKGGRKRKSKKSKKSIKNKKSIKKRKSKKRKN